MNLGLSGKHAAITGGAHGLGLAIAELFASEGAYVGIIDKDATAASAATERLNTPGTSAYAVAADVSRPDDVSRALDAVTDRAPLDILVVNAGVYQATVTEDVSVEEWDNTQSVNLRGAFLCIRSALGAMKERHSGSIVCVASLAGRSGGIHAGTAYASSKAGLIGFCRALAAEVAPYGVRVNCVNPGVIDTDMTKRLPDHLRDSVVAQHPAHRWGTPHEVAAAVAFLASPKASWIAGAQLDVNGGVWPAP